MKKFLVVLLACAMIFGFASTAFAADEQIKEFSDIADQPQAAKTAIMKLAILGVLEGNEGIGGPFRPGENLTRAEFAKIVCYLTDSVKQASSLETLGSKFSDVASGQWFTGFVNAAAASGLFVGDPGGTFRPNANITMNEVVTVAMRCVGYTDMVSQKRVAGNVSWPISYVTKANAVGILDDVTFSGPTAATRADMAIICSEVLSLNLVEYIASDIAYSLALSDDKCDADGFSEIQYRSNETDLGARYESILSRAFKCEQKRVVFDVAKSTNFTTITKDELAAWHFVDFKDGELGFAMNIGDLEVASLYYINKDFTMFELAGMQADVIINDDDEVIFVGVRTSYAYADEVYDDAGRIIADGKSYRTASMPTKWDANGNATAWVADAKLALTSALPTKSGDALPAKLYINKDGQVYAVKNYDGFNDRFAIFDEIKENVLEYKTGSLAEKLNVVKDDYVIIKDNQFIEAEDLEEFEILYYLGKASGAKIYMAIGYQEGKFDFWDKTKETLRVESKALKGVGEFKFSPDGGDSWQGGPISGLKDIEESTYGDAIFAKGYLWTKLSYLAANTASTKIIGVVTKIEPASVHISGSTFGAQYQKVTIYTTEGKSETFDFHKDFKNIYNTYVALAGTFPAGAIAANTGGYVHPAWTLGADATKAWEAVAGSTSTTPPGPNKGEDFEGFNEGDIVQLILDKSDNVKKIANYAAFENDTPPAVKIKAQTTNERVVITGGNTTTEGNFGLPKDAVIFCVTPDYPDFDDVKLVSVASVLAGDLDVDKAVAFDVKSSGAINVLYYIGDTSSVMAGVVTRIGEDNGNDVYRMNGEWEPGDGTALTHRPALVNYTLVGGEIKIGKYWAWDGGKDATLVPNAAAIPIDTGSDYSIVMGDCKYNSGTTKNLKINSGYSLIFNSDTYIFDLQTGDEAGDVDLDDLNDSTVIAVYNKDYVLVTVVLVETGGAIPFATPPTNIVLAGDAGNTGVVTPFAFAAATLTDTADITGAVVGDLLKLTVTTVAGTTATITVDGAAYPAAGYAITAADITAGAVTIKVTITEASHRNLVYTYDVDVL